VLKISAKRGLIYFQVPYQAYLSTQFSIAYDAFLSILWQVDRKVTYVLHQDTPDWHLHNVCPSCFYKLENKPSLKFSLLVLMDSNNSLWRMGDAMRGTNVHLDTRTLASDCWIKPEDVEWFKNEVKMVCPIQNRLFKAYYDVTVNAASRIWHRSRWWLGGCSSQFRCLYMHWSMAKCWTRTAEGGVCPVW